MIMWKLVSNILNCVQRITNTHWPKILKGHRRSRQKRLKFESKRKIPIRFYLHRMANLQSLRNTAVKNPSFNMPWNLNYILPISLGWVQSVSFLSNQASTLGKWEWENEKNYQKFRKMRKITKSSAGGKGGRGEGSCFHSDISLALTGGHTAGNNVFVVFTRTSVKYVRLKVNLINSEHA